MSKKKRKKEQKIEIQNVEKRRMVYYDDKSKFLTKETRSILFFVIWFVGFFVIMIFAWKQ